MGHSTESTVYIKGARKRDEMNFGPYSHVSILVRPEAHHHLCPNSKSYTVYKLDDEDTPLRPRQGRAEAEVGQG